MPPRINPGPFTGRFTLDNHDMPFFSPNVKEFSINVHTPPRFMEFSLEDGLRRAHDRFTESGRRAVSAYLAARDGGPLVLTQDRGRITSTADGSPPFVAVVEMKAGVFNGDYDMTIITPDGTLVTVTFNCGTMQFRDGDFSRESSQITIEMPVRLWNVRTIVPPEETVSTIWRNHQESDLDTEILKHETGVYS